MTTRDWREKAIQAGILPEYQNATGETVALSDSVIERLLDCVSPTTADAPYLYCVRQEAPSLLELPLSECDPDAIYCLLDENQTSLWQGRVALDRDKSGFLSLPVLSLGYYQIFCDEALHGFLVIAPTKTFQNDPSPSWGINVQLYGLRSQYNWGIGDFADLQTLVRFVAEQGGDFVGINPIHGLFPAMPDKNSPYSPSSRQAWNFLYISVPDVEEFSLSTEVQKWVTSEDFQRQLIRLRAKDWVDHLKVTELKRTVLRQLHSVFLSEHAKRYSIRFEQYRRFVIQGGQTLYRYALFEALHWHLCQDDPLCWGWPAFPPDYQDPNADAVQRFAEQHESDIAFSLYLQWVAHEQKSQAQDLAKSLGMRIGVYQDLPVGCDAGGAETWGNKSHFALNASVGAPPDPLGPAGQNWGLPPWQPSALQLLGFQPWRELLRANMKDCGALRIDHVLGLMRLWWVPHGEQASDGGYVRQDMAALLAILALESHRAKCEIIGEDLGTVDPEFRAHLQQEGIASYKVLLFETAADGGFISPNHYPTNSLATVCTHDMPPLWGFWQGEDIARAQSLGWFSSKVAQQEQQNRQQGLGRLLESVQWHGFVEMIDPNVCEPIELAQALYRHLAAGQARLLSIQWEDVLGMTVPVNVPGTCEAFPNWRRKLPKDLDVLCCDEALRTFFQAITALRQKSA